VRDGLLEVPVTTVRLGNRNLPSSGGGYFRLLPYALSRWMLRRSTSKTAQSRHLLFPPVGDRSRASPHPGISSKTRFRHYVNIDRMEQRLDALLRDFRWGRMDRHLPAPMLLPAGLRPRTETPTP
jgi:hypothetical protein